jgi:preprotein translocase subunit SecA
MVNNMGLPDDMPIDAKLLSGAIEGAQKRLEEQNFKRRKHVLAYDDIMNQQRTIIYKQRQDVLNGENISATIRKMIETTVSDTAMIFTGADNAADWDLEGLRSHYLGTLTTEDDFQGENAFRHRDEVVDLLVDRALARYQEKDQLFDMENISGSEVFREVERAILLQNVDRAWMDHIDAMDDLKGSIGLQSFANRDPVTEYRLQGAEMFDAMVSEIRENTVRMVLSAVPRQKVERVQVANPLNAGFEGAGKGAPKKIVMVQRTRPTRVGRNDPCPCGSGKKYKKCCGAGTSDSDNN